MGWSAWSGSWGVTSSLRVRLPRSLAWLVTLVFTQASALAEPPFAPCESRRGSCVVDGDTFQIDGVRVRIENIDAPELHGARCRAEAVLALNATERLAELLGAGSWRLEAAPGERRDEDRYGRKLRRLVMPEGDAGELLIADGLAKRWTGEKSSWCL